MRLVGSDNASSPQMLDRYDNGQFYTHDGTHESSLRTPAGAWCWRAISPGVLLGLWPLRPWFYLTELNRLHGWPTAVISGAITSFFICSPLRWWCSQRCDHELDPRLVMLSACCSAARGAAPRHCRAWQLYLAYLLMPSGAASMPMSAPSPNVVGFGRSPARPCAQPGADGASAGGILVTRCWCWHRTLGFSNQSSARHRDSRYSMPRLRCGSTRPPLRSCTQARARDRRMDRRSACEHEVLSVAPIAMALTAESASWCIRSQPSANHRPPEAGFSVAG